MTYTYPAVFMKKSKNESYEIYFPDLDRITNGNGLDEGIAMATDMLAMSLYAITKNNDNIPNPTQINSIDPSQIIKKLQINNVSESFVNYISVNLDEYQKKHITKYDKKTLTIPHWINVIATSRGINFSKTLTEALIEKLNI